MPTVEGILNNRLYDDAGNFENQNYLGGNFDFLQNYLKDASQSGMPFKDMLRQQSTGAINRSFDRRSNQIDQSLASRGTYGSGIMAAMQGQLAGKEANAIAQNEASLNRADINYRQNAISNLLGLNQFEGQQEMGITNMLNNIMQQNKNRGLRKQQLEQAEFDFFRDLLPGIVQGGATVGAAAVGGGG